MNLKNLNILITGGASGIGLAFAEQLIARGNRVMICGRNKKRLLAAQQKIPKLIVHTCDITKTNDVEDLISEIDHRFVTLHILINNAGIQNIIDFTDTNENSEKIRREIDINLIAPMQLCLRLLPRMHEKHSTIINISSALAFAPKQSTPAYSAAKAGLRNFSQTLRYQLKKRCINVVDIVPALVQTNMTTQQRIAKISPQYLVEKSLKSIARGKNTIYIEKARWLYCLYRLCPSLAWRILQHG